MQHKLFTASVVADVTLGERQIRVVANSGKSDRVKDVLIAKGCKLDNYRANNIVLADHNPERPIGNFDPEIKGDQVEGVLTFAPAGISPKADEYCGLYKAGVLKTVSVGFGEIDVEPIKGGGCLFKEWELLELSCVAVPCDPAAVVTQRALKLPGMWKCGASRNLPLADETSYDSRAAAERIFEKAGFDGDNPDTAWARKAFLAYDASQPKLKSSYNLPFADVIEGRLVAIKAGVRMAAFNLPHADIDDVEEKAGAAIDHYERRFKEEDGKAVTAPLAKTAPIKIKGLYDVACLASLLAELGWAQSSAEYEAAFEEDGSKVPAMLAEALRVLADAFLAMSAEEVQELLADRAGLDESMDDGDESLPSATKAIRATLAAAKAATKAGRAISGENAKCLGAAMKCMEAAIGHVKSAHDHVDGVVGKSKPSEDEDDAGEDSDNELAFEAARRKRDVAVLALSETL